MYTLERRYKWRSFYSNTPAMKKICLFFVVSSFFFQAKACLNEYHVNREGKGTLDNFSMYKVSFLKGFDTVQLNQELKKLMAAPDKNSLQVQNDIAVKLIKLGRLEEASVILETLYKEYPNEYNVVINKGTLYELMGKNEMALELIKAAMKINPGSHDGSEWFHVRVLEAKINNNQVDSMSTKKILELGTLKIKSTYIVEHVVHQLQERIPFTPVPNLAMANMLNEFGDYLADSLSVSGAWVIYNIARDYYPAADVFDITPKLAEMKKLIRKYKVKYPNYKNYFISMDDYYRRKRNGQRFDSFLDKLIDISSKF